MKPNTTYWIGIKHIGDANMIPIVEEMPVREMPKAILKYLAETTLLKRIEIMIGRSKEDLESRLVGVGYKAGNTFEDLDAMWDDMMNDPKYDSIGE